MKTLKFLLLAIVGGSATIRAQTPYNFTLQLAGGTGSVYVDTLIIGGTSATSLIESNSPSGHRYGLLMLNGGTSSGSSFNPTGFPLSVFQNDPGFMTGQNSSNSFALAGVTNINIATLPYLTLTTANGLYAGIGVTNFVGGTLASSNATPYSANVLLQANALFAGIAVTNFVGGTLASSNATPYSANILLQAAALFDPLGLATSRTKLRFALVPGQAELAGASTEPLLVESAGVSNNWGELQYNDTVTNRTYFVLPASAGINWQGGAVTNHILWYAQSATNGNTVLFVQYRTVGTNGLFDLSFPPSHMVTNAVSSTRSNITDSLVIFTPSAAEMVVGQTTVIQLGRDAPNAGDTMVSNLNVVSISGQE